MLEAIARAEDSPSEVRAAAAESKPARLFTLNGPPSNPGVGGNLLLCTFGQRRYRRYDLRQNFAGDRGCWKNAHMVPKSATRRSILYCYSWCCSFLHAPLIRHSCDQKGGGEAWRIFNGLGLRKNARCRVQWTNRLDQVDDRPLFYWKWRVSAWKCRLSSWKWRVSAWKC